ncbi:MAG: helix-turn-helix domain-containing protein [Candidatus Brocadiaceae bacterium]|nr:helix-turn-helix domain-containing protein [Candidatus Brocadiaceae bacterium]
MNNHQWMSVGDIARELGMPIHQINYYLAIFCVVPAERIAGKRVFSREVMAVFAGMIEERRKKRNAKQIQHRFN